MKSKAKKTTAPAEPQCWWCQQVRPYGCLHCPRHAPQAPNAGKPAPQAVRPAEANVGALRGTRRNPELPRIYAASGPPPVPLASSAPEDVLAWAEAVRDHYERTRKAHLTLSGLGTLVYGRLDAYDVFRTLAALYPDDADCDRLVTSAMIGHGRAVEQAAEPVKLIGPARPQPKPMPVAPPKPPADKPKPAGPLRTGVVLGYAATAAVRALGRAGWAVDRVAALLGKLGVPLADNTVKIQVRAGATKDYSRGAPAPLTKKELQHLDGLCPSAAPLPAGATSAAAPKPTKPSTSAMPSSSSSARAAAGPSSKSSKKRRPAK